MKAAFVVPSRNKIHGIHGAVNSVLAQTLSPMELVFSDQGSTDGTRQAIQKLCDSYDGPNKVRILDCPLTDIAQGMAGFNAHVDWLMGQTDADIIIIGTADDVNDVTRAEKVIAKYADTGAAMVGNTIQFMQVNGTSMATEYPEESRFVTADEMMHKLVGGSTAQSWRHDFYDKIGGVHGNTCPDVYMPYLATQDDGFYYLRDILYCLIRWPDKNNTGIGGRTLAAESDEEKLKLQELVQYQLTSTYKEIAEACKRVYPNWSTNDQGTLYGYLVGTASYWAQLRDEMYSKQMTQDLRP